VGTYEIDGFFQKGKMDSGKVFLVGQEFWVKGFIGIKGGNFGGV